MKVGCGSLACSHTPQEVLSDVCSPQRGFLVVCVAIKMQELKWQYSALAKIGWCHSREGV
jgi:hypothetical protein